MKLLRSKKSRVEPLSTESIKCEGIELWKGWLVLCNNLHRNHCSWSAKQSKFLTCRPAWLIDVVRACIVPATAHDRYVALSYVWGAAAFTLLTKANMETMQIDNALAGGGDGQITIPRTVSDTIGVVKSLGERFLWVDALCIVQDDEAAKESQLQGMAAIYANAYLTVIAASGNGANHGLFGVRIGDERTSSTRWARRGWTFQEDVFSRRKLIFRNGRVIWKCHCSKTESDFGLDKRGMTSEHHCTKPISMPGSISWPFPSLPQFITIVLNYNQRDLTLSGDILNAIKGVLNVLSHSYPGGFVWGTPLVFFDVLLLWQPLWPLTRRREAPSWSWMGGHGQLDPLSWMHTGGYEHVRHGLVGRSGWGNDFFTRGTVKMDLDSVVKWYALDSPDAAPSSRMAIPSLEFAQYRYLAADQEGIMPLPPGWRRWRSDAKDKAVFDSQCRNPSKKFQKVQSEIKKEYPKWVFTFDPDPDVLFWYPIPTRDPSTLSATIAEPAMGPQFSYIACRARRGYLTIGNRFLQVDHSHVAAVSLYDRETGHWAGVMRLNQARDSDSATPLGETCQLIAISAGTVHNDEGFDRNGFMEEWYKDVIEERRATSEAEPGGFQALYEFYNVMWIEWEAGIAYRKALGRVKKSMWYQLDTEEIDVVLG